MSNPHRFPWPAIILVLSGPSVALTADEPAFTAGDFKKQIATYAGVIQTALQDPAKGHNRAKARTAALQVAAAAEFAEQGIPGVRGLRPLQERALEVIKAIDSDKFDDARKLAGTLPDWNAGPLAAISSDRLTRDIYVEDLMAWFTTARRGGMGGEAYLTEMERRFQSGELKPEHLDHALFATAFQATTISGLVHSLAPKGNASLQRTWRSASSAVSLASVDLARAVKARNVEKAGLALSSINQACNRCHNRLIQAFQDRNIVLGAMPFATLMTDFQDQKKAFSLRAEIAKEMAGREQQKQQVIPILIEGLRENDKGFRQVLMQLLKQLEVAERTAFSSLNEHLWLLDPYRRYWFGRGLASARTTDEAVAFLGQAITNEQASIRETAANLLGIMGPAAVPAIPQLEKAARDTEPAVRKAAVMAVWNINPKLQVQTLANALKESDPVLRGKAARALAEVGPAAVPVLAKVLEDENRDARMSAAFALGKIGPEARGAVPALRALQEADDALLRLAATSALGKIEKPVKP